MAGAVEDAVWVPDDSDRLSWLEDSGALLREPSDAVLVIWTRRLHADDGAGVVDGADDGPALAIADESEVWDG